MQQGEKKKKVAIYLRVSTDRQDYENQLIKLKEYAEKREWEIYKVYSEVMSGKERNRPVFRQMLEDAKKREFDVILVWALDRFTREGTMAVWHYFDMLSKYGIEFVSYTEPYLNTDNELVRDILLSIMGALAKQERIRIAERTKAGLERARMQGKKLGRPEVMSKVRDKVIELYKQGKTYRQIVEEVYYWDNQRRKRKISLGMVSQIIREYRANSEFSADVVQQMDNK